MGVRGGKENESKREGMETREGEGDEGSLKKEVELYDGIWDEIGIVIGSTTITCCR